MLRMTFIVLVALLLPKVIIYVYKRIQDIRLNRALVGMNTPNQDGSSIQDIIEQLAYLGLDPSKFIFEEAIVDCNINGRPNIIRYDPVTLANIESDPYATKKYEWFRYGHFGTKIFTLRRNDDLSFSFTVGLK